jgi:Tfp pilus assembly protein PilN
MTEQLAQETIETQVAEAPGPVRISWAMVPRVNLLPIEIVEGRRFRRTQIILGSAVICSLLVAGGATFLAQRGISDANDRLTAAQARVTSLQAEQTRYAAVPQVIAQVNAANTARTLAMGTEVLWYRYLSDIDGARPSGVALTTITVTAAAPASAAVPSSNPLAAPGVGSILVTGTAKQYSQVATWLDSIGKITGFSSPSLTSAGKGDPNLIFSTGAIVDSDALSGRYAKEVG